MKSSSTSWRALARLARRVRESWLVEVLLVAVILMTGANLLALHTIQKEMSTLATPGQHNDLWHVVNIARELQRLEYGARKAQGAALGDPAYDELGMRLDVLLSLLVPDEDAPKVSTEIISRLPNTQATLEKFGQQVLAWSYMLANKDTYARVPGQIVERSEALATRLNEAVVEVHLSITEVRDDERIALYHRFFLLHGMLFILQLGMAALAAKLIRDRIVLKRLTDHLSQLNRSLERRVEQRTHQLAESKALLLFILNSSPSEVSLVDAETGEVHFINQCLRQKLAQDAEFKRLPIEALLAAGPERARLLDELERYGRVDHQEVLIAADTPYWCALSIKLVEVEDKLAYLIWGYDTSRHRELLAALESQANTDMLTGLCNRRAFIERGEQLLAGCRRHRQPCGVLMLDIDFFKRINDTHGHAAGDEVLRSVSATLCAALRESDLFGRLGGEEFALVLPHTDAAQTLQTAERLRRIAEHSVPRHAGCDLPITISVGLASLGHDTDTLEKLLDRADKALYRAKQTGRNRVHS